MITIYYTGEGSTRNRARGEDGGRTGEGRGQKGEAEAEGRGVWGG